MNPVVLDAGMLLRMLIKKRYGYGGLEAAVGATRVHQLFIPWQLAAHLSRVSLISSILASQHGPVPGGLTG